MNGLRKIVVELYRKRLEFPGKNGVVPRDFKHPRDSLQQAAQAMPRLPEIPRRRGVFGARAATVFLSRR